MIDPRDQTPDQFEALAATLRVDARTVRRLYSALLGHGIFDPGVWGRSFQIPRRLSDAISPLPRLTLDRVQTSAADGFQKLRLLTHDGLALETVLIPLHKPEPSAFASRPRSDV